MAANTWMFGGSDKGLEKHRDKLNPAIDIEGSVAVYGQNTAIVDLVFSRSTRCHRSNDVENLVVELKAPRVVIGSEEIIEENRARLQFFQEHLQHSADDSQALKYLQERHAALLNGVLEPEVVSGDDAVP